MNAAVAEPVAHATIDAEGRLLDADPALIVLNQYAGGSIGAALAVPQLATIARLARRLGIVVSRGVVVSDEETDVDLWVRAQPQGDCVRLSVSGWRDLHPWRGGAGARQAEIDFQRTDADWCWETDAALRLTFLSPDAGPRFGFDAVGMLGRPLGALFTPDPDHHDAIPLSEALARHRPLDKQPARLGSLGRSIILSAAVRRDGFGAFAGFVGSVRMAEPVSANQATFVPELSPSFIEGLDKVLRSPLARIVAHADSIHAQAEGPLRRDYVDYAADIGGAARHLLGLVDDLVDLDAIERPSFSLTNEVIDLAEIGRRAAALLSVPAGHACVTILRPLSGERLDACGNPRHTLQILVNLLDNAARYALPGSSVEVAVGRRRYEATITVSGRGKGIAPEDQARIFDKFERVDRSEPGGTGLGLYIARKLARAMGGDIVVESESGRDTRFTLSLPTPDAPRRKHQ